jgi:hypothetical protein
MSRVPDKDLEQAEAAVAAEDAATAAPIGKVEIDSRGHNVWRWARDVIGSTSVLLKRLDNKDLALEPTQKVPIMRGRDSGPKTSISYAPTAAAKAGVAKISAGKTAGGTPVVSKADTRHPTLQLDRRDGKGGGFDPYNSR